MENDLTSLKARSLLYIENLYKSYGDKLVLDNVDFALGKDEICSLVGPSGCGKSTLLRLILGQERSDSGDILIEGKEIGFPDSTRGIVYQKYSVFPNLTVIGNVLLGKRLSAGVFERRRHQKEFRDEAMYYLEHVNLAEHVAKYPHELSGGMQQRVAIVQALIVKPKMILMDEPFGALDPGTREHLQIFLLELWEKFKMTIIFVTHDLEEAVFLGTRIVVLSQFYTDGRGNGKNVKRGAKIMADYQLERKATSTVVKESEKFGKLIQQIRRDGFDPNYLQHATRFNLYHHDSFQTLCDEEKCQ